MKPMLATRYDLSQVKFPCVVQPKYDGVRCIIAIGDDGEVHLTSRTGKEYNVPLVKKWAEQNKAALPLDGELYVHKKLTFQQICSAVKCESELTKQLRYVVYDRPIVGWTFENRTANLGRHILLNSAPVYLSMQFEAKSEKDILMWHKLFVDNGYEGAIIRNTQGRYVEGRSNDLMKLKVFDTDEYEIVDVLEAGGLDKGTSIFKLKVGGLAFCARPTGSKQLRAAYLADKEKLIGKMATVQHQGFSDAGVPRFPVMLTIRDYE